MPILMTLYQARVALFLLFWSAIFSGLLLRSNALTYLPIHFISSGVLPILLGLYLLNHWWTRRHRIAKHTNSRYGYVALIALFILYITGIALLRWTNVPALRWSHSAAALLLVVDLSWHILWQIRRKRGQALVGAIRAKSIPADALRVKGAWVQQAWVQWASCGLLIASFFFGFNVVTSETDAFFRGTFAASTFSGSFFTDKRIASNQNPKPQFIPLEHKGLGAHEQPTSTQCAECHPQITEQWHTSAHAISATDPYYQALTALFIQERGVNAARYCASCHNPLGLLKGEIAFDSVSTDEVDIADDKKLAHAYDARALGVTLGMSHEAAEGVTCVMCHQATNSVVQSATGGTNLVALAESLPQEPLDQLALLVSPDNHSQAMRPALLKQSELCGSCHNLHTPDGFALEPTYDEWQASPYAEQGITCQSCHMPAVTGKRTKSGAMTWIPSHGGQPGAPSTLDGVADSTTLLRQAVTLTATLHIQNRPQSRHQLNLNVQVTNSGAGHYFPTGADDLRQVWLEVVVYDERGNIIWKQGVLDEFGRLPVNALRFGKVIGDAHGNPVSLHRFWVATQILEDTRLAPLETRTLAIPIELPQGKSSQMAVTELSVRVRLLYQDVSQEFAEFAFDQPMDNLPIFEVSTLHL